VPENDPTTLFTGSGMQPLLPYLLGEPHPKGKRLTNSQKSFRAEDIEEVGDNRHTTFFEMLGNWSLGDYWKEEQLVWLFEFLTKEIELPAERLWVTCFAGDKALGIPADTESAEIWKKIGIPKERIRFCDAEKNWWSRAGVPERMPAGEPGGPDSEVFFDFRIPHNPKYGAECHPNCQCGRFMEIGNSVFMQYQKREDGTFSELPQKNIDFGGGLERISAALNDNPDIFESSPLNTIIQTIEKETGISYSRATESDRRGLRIVADHLRAGMFLIADGVHPGPKEQEYMVRRLLRRAILFADRLAITGVFLKIIAAVVSEYRNHYPLLYERREAIEGAIWQEERDFLKTISRGMRIFEKLPKRNGVISGRDAFILATTHGFPLELTKEIAVEYNAAVDTEAFLEEMEKHREVSRAGAEQKFKGGLADTSEKTVMLHTATHLMLAGLRKFMGKHVHQAGSNITTERTRFDFTHPEKVDREILDKVEDYVNEAIRAGAEVIIEQMQKEEAQKSDVEGSFWEKYPDTVNVYKVVGTDGTVYSEELCGGPHVKNTGMIVGTFKIVKEEAVAAGIRRVKAILTE
jgi:alanyl-tRNA synthetase